MESTHVYLFVPFLAAALIYLHRWNTKTRSHSVPPSPRTPFISNLLDSPNAKTEQALDQWAKGYGSDTVHGDVPNQPTTASVPIAIVGISLELPSGHYSDANLSYDDFFEFLLQKGESYETIPSDRFNIADWKGPNLGQVLSERGSFLKNVSHFDPVEFGITSKDVKAMPTGTRKLIEHSFLALWDSGILYRGQNVGSYMSAVNFDITSHGGYNDHDVQGALVGAPAMIANRVSYHLDLRGPSFSLDTACSSTATALHLAVQGIRNGDCKAAVVGGAQINTRLVDFMQYSQGGILAPDGKCKPFDASANGFSRSEGVAAVVLKPLEDALKDGDFVYASILGTGINSTGSSGPVNAPIAASQEEAMRRAYSQTNKKPEDVDYIELHATGTAVGDPTEANWVGKAFQRESNLIVGSTKGNVGHLEITSFMASLAKVCGLFRTKQLPPTANLSTRNPKIRWDEYRLVAPTEVTEITPRNDQFLVSITSSGIGGSNAHVVVESVPQHLSPYDSEAFETPALLMSGGLSPRSTTALAADVSKLAIENAAKPSSISTIYGRRAVQMPWRSFAVRTPGNNTIQFSEPTLSPRTPHPLVFVISGQGPQHIEMGRQLFQFNSVFRDSILDMDAMYRNATGKSLMTSTGLFSSDGSAPALPIVWPISVILPSLAFIHIALIDVLRSINIAPDALIGHSAGETAAFYASGACPRAMAVEIAIARGRAMSELETLGATMAAVACNEAQVKVIIDEVKLVHPGEDNVLEIACYNGPDAIALGGHVFMIEAAANIARKQGIMVNILKTNVPVHSSLMNKCYTTYSSAMKDIFSRYPGDFTPQIPLFSTLTGERWDAPFSETYFWRNARYPVQFTRAVQAVQHAFPDPMFVEISPHAVLSSYLTTMGVPQSLSFCPMRRTKAPTQFHEPIKFEFYARARKVRQHTLAYDGVLRRTA